MLSPVNVVVLDHLVSTIAYQHLLASRPTYVCKEVIPVPNVSALLASDASAPFELLLEFMIFIAARAVQIDAKEKLIHARLLRMSRFAERGVRLFSFCEES
jgi:hypothetical protein